MATSREQRHTARRALALVLVDDDAAIRILVRAQAARSPQVELRGEADDGAAAVELVADLQPDVVLLDLLMPTPGLDVLPSLRRVCPAAAVIAWSADPALLEQAGEAGADDALAKVTPWADVVDRMVELARSRHDGIDGDPKVRHGTDPGVVRLVPDAIEVLAVAPFELTAPAADHAAWPCPGCGTRRPLVGASALDIANRTGAPMRRSVVVCALCAETLGARTAPTA